MANNITVLGEQRITCNTIPSIAFDDAVSKIINIINQISYNDKNN